MLGTFRFRMEDPDGEKWDSDSLTEIYNIFTDAQRLGVELKQGVKHFQHLRELEKTSSLDLSGGSANLPSLYFLPMWMQDNNGNFRDITQEPPRSTKASTFFSQEDVKTAYIYIHGTKLYLKGYDSTAGSWILGYINKPADIDGSNNPVLSNHMNHLTIAISEWLGWGIDRQFDRQLEVDQQILKLFGVSVSGLSRNDSK